MRETIWQRTSKLTEIIDTFLSDGKDLRLVLYYTLVSLRAHCESLEEALDAIELRVESHDDYEDLKIFLAEIAKKRDDENPIKRMLGL